MTDGGAAFQPGTEEARVPFRPRGTYAGYRAFGSGDGAVLVDTGGHAGAADRRGVRDPGTAHHRRPALRPRLGRRTGRLPGHRRLPGGRARGEPRRPDLRRRHRPLHPVGGRPAAAARRRRQDVLRRSSRRAGGAPSPRWASSAPRTSRRRPSWSARAASACSCTVPASTGEPPTWDRTARPPTRPGRSSRRRRRAGAPRGPSRRRARRPGTRPGRERRTSRQARSWHRSRCRPGGAPPTGRPGSVAPQQRQAASGAAAGGGPGGGQPPFASPREGG